MVRPPADPPFAPDAPEPTSPAGEPGSGGAGGDPAPPIDLSGLPIAGFTRRRAALVAGIAAIAWVVLSIGRQVGDVNTVNARADDLRASNAEVTAQVDRMEDELRRIQRPEFVAQQARAYRLGTSDEIPFRLADNAPPLAPNAPGSASTAVGAETDRPSPLDTWLDLLFGPAD